MRLETQPVTSIETPVKAKYDVNSSSTWLGEASRSFAMAGRIGDDQERDAPARVVGVGQEGLVEARRTCVEQAEAVPAPVDLEEPLCPSIDKKDIAGNSASV
jgi:hypothetical protein